MSTKVHDDNDDDETFDEVDVILENAKAGLQLKRNLERKSRRHINLSDIPENFAHVPVPSKIKSEFISRPWTPPHHEPAVHQLQAQAQASNTRQLQCTKQTRSLFRATWRWLRHRLMVEYRTYCDMCGRSVVTSVHVPTRSAARHRS